MMEYYDFNPIMIQKRDSQARWGHPQLGTHSHLMWLGYPFGSEQLPSVIFIWMMMWLNSASLPELALILTLHALLTVVVIIIRELLSLASAALTTMPICWKEMVC